MQLKRRLVSIDPACDIQFIQDMSKEYLAFHLFIAELIVV